MMKKGISGSMTNVQINAAFIRLMSGNTERLDSDSLFCLIHLYYSLKK